MKRFVLCLLLALLLAPNLRAQDADTLAPLVQVIAQTDDPQFQLDILKGMSEGLKGRRGVKMPAGWEEAAAKLAKSPNAAVRELTQSLSVTFGSRAAFAALRLQLMDAKAEVAVRKSALDSLLGAKDAELVTPLQTLLKDPALRGAVLRGLAAYDDAKTPAAILEIYKSLAAAEKKDALTTLASRVGFAKPLLAALAQGTISSKDLSADIVRSLRNLKNDEINGQVEKLWGVTRESPEDKLRETAKYKAMVLAKSNRADDPMRGRAVFARTCQQCHMLFDLGGKVGPDLTGSNRADLDYVLHNVIDPNAEIPNDYRTSILETKDDRNITGIVTRQDEKTVTIVTPNEVLTLPRNEIKSLQQSELSMMPEGLIQSFSNEEVHDLVAYLKSPRQVPLQVMADNVGNFFSGKDLSYWDGDADLWKVENGEIVGRSPGLKRNEFLKSQLSLGDFRLVVKVKLVPNAGNSGIQFHSEALPDGEMKGCQADVGVGWWGKLYEENGRGLLAKEGGEASVKVDDWNTYEVLAVGSKIRLAINGKLCVDLDDPQVAKTGVIGFQLHSGGVFEVRFKDLKLELDPKFELTTVK